MLSTRSLPALGLALLMGSLVTRPASADLCFPTPGSGPGIDGPPNWQPPGIVRVDLNEARWTTPLTPFASDPTYDEGHFRIMTNPAGDRLYVSFQTDQDHDAAGGPSPTNQDYVYFGLTNPGVDSTAHVVRLKVAPPEPGTPISGFVPVVEVTTYDYAAPTWTPTPGAPAWLEQAVSWSKPKKSTPSQPTDDPYDWGITFQVNLAALAPGYSTTPFKVLMAMTIRDETNAMGTSISTMTPIDPSADFNTTFLVTNPNPETSWLPASPSGAGCIGGISLSSSMIGAQSSGPGIGQTQIDTTPGRTVTFYAQPDYGAIVPFGGMLTADFRIANWGTVADPNAGWTPIPAANTVPSLPSGRIEFVCPPNTASLTCGMPVPTQKHQCMQVRLNRGVGVSPELPIATPAVYRNMDFVPLSSNERVAEISTRGLAAVLKNDQPREIYLYVYPRHLHDHGDEPIYLPTEAMAETRRLLLTAPPPPRGQLKSARELAAHLKELRRLAALGRGATKAEADRVALDEKAIPPSQVTREQAVRKVWPHLDVRPYYATGKSATEGGKEIRALVPMYPFTLFFSHEGPLYGYEYHLEGVGGAQLQELRAPSSHRPGLYKLVIPNEGTASIRTFVEAYETAKTEKQPKDTPPCPPKEIVVEKRGTCNCSMPGLLGSGGSLGFVGLGLGVVGAAWARRRRRS